MDEINSRLNLAVDSILDRCAAGPNSPLGTLDECLAQFAEDPLWSPAEIEWVRSTVIQMIQDEHY